MDGIVVKYKYLYFGGILHDLSDRVRTGGSRMAKELLNRVRDAEAQSEAIIAEAKTLAAKTLEDAHAQAQQLVEHRSAEAKARAQAALDETAAACDAQLHASSEETAKICAALCAAAEKNRDQVIEQAIKKYF